jgi:uncharacterized protein YraI
MPIGRREGVGCRGALETSLMHFAKAAVLAGLGLLALSGARAEARPWSGYVVANVNERAGPSTIYPSVIVIPAWSPVVIYGCLGDYTWCDVSWGPQRGWVAAAYIQVTYGSQPVPLANYIAPLGVPIIAFDFDTYWDDYYRGRPFFGYSYRWRHLPPDHFRQPPPPPPGSFNRPPPGYNLPPNGYGKPPHYPPPQGYNQPPPGNYPPPPNGGPMPPKYPQGYGQYPQDNGNGPPNFGQQKPRMYKPFNDNNPQSNGQFEPGRPPKNFGTGGTPPQNGVPPGCHLDHGELICPPR